ncbi:MAG: DNA repair protein RecN [Lachnospiraceae bacterium]|nr:DNA repair protein RecN [Lachnospiraceae bacterium]
MLNSLHVKNLALIEETEVEFGNGLNILTGETGAGKSIIIGSINLALGAKADKDMIRTGAESAFIELVFTLDSEAQREKCRELMLDTEDDMLVITRRIAAGKSLCRANGETVTAKQLKELAGVLIDVYGQHEHQSLTAAKKQFEILDNFCGAELEGIKKELAGEYKRYKELLREWEDADTGSASRQKESDLIEFELKEIEEAQLAAGEDELLEADYRRMANGRKILENVSSAAYLLGNAEGESISEMTGRALRELKSVEAYDETLSGFTEQLSQIEELVLDVRRELSDYQEGLEFEPEEFDRTQRRLDLINHLKSKYGNTIEEILAYEKRQSERLLKLSNYDAYLEDLRREIDTVKEKLLALCRRASNIRREQAKTLEEKMLEALHDLNFLDVEFQIEIRSDEEQIHADGFDETVFLISTNPGEPVRPLANVASGGELSRIMLGLKTVMAEKDAVDTLIFDEIDAGISGKTAWQVSKKLALLGREHQIICITHLAQIAAMADVHFKIEKKQEENHTSTGIFRLNETESTNELARLLGSDLLTQAAVSNAKEMKELAERTKAARKKTEK